MSDLTLRPVDPAGDAALLHGWVTQERATFWGMRENSLAEVEEIYSYIDDQPHLAAYLLEAGGIPVALFQTYDPAVDEIGEFYDRRPGDVGVHLLLADTPVRAGRTSEITAWLMQWVFSDPSVQRIVVEPDARNAKSLRLFGLVGAVAGPEVEMPHKPAQFGFLTRDALERAGVTR